MPQTQLAVSDFTSLLLTAAHTFFCHSDFSSMNFSASSSTAFAKCTLQSVYQQGTVLMRYMSCHEQMCQLSHDVESITYRKMIKGSNTYPPNFLCYRDRFPSEYAPQKDAIFKLTNIAKKYSYFYCVRGYTNLLM